MIERIVPFTAGDGLALNLIHLQGDTPPTKGPVILVHGAGVRANIFRAPVKTTIVDLLIAAGYDVWLENWRACIDLQPNLWTLDQAAVHDHPYAVRTVIKETGADHLKALIHCQGSTSFMMSAVAGLVPEVTTIVSNAVSLHPVVPWWSNVKLKVAVPMLARITQWLNCQWGLDAPTPLARWIQLMVNLTHHECHNPVCKQVSFTYGAGFPALWRHQNLDEGTHDWLKHEFAWVPLRFFQQISRCVSAGHLVAVEQLPRAAGRLHRRAAADRRPLRLLRRREEPLLPPREPGADPRLLRPPAPRLPHAPPGAGVQPPRRLHGGPRGAGRAAADGGGARPHGVKDVTKGRRPAPEG